MGLYGNLAADWTLANPISVQHLAPGIWHNQFPYKVAWYMG